MKLEKNDKNLVFKNFLLTFLIKFSENKNDKNIVFKNFLLTFLIKF